MKTIFFSSSSSSSFVLFLLLFVACLASSTEKRVRVCRTCYSTGKNFRRALLQGSYLGAMEAYSTGCVNLRDPCSHVSEEVNLNLRGKQRLAASILCACTYSSRRLVLHVSDTRPGCLEERPCQVVVHYCATRLPFPQRPDLFSES